MKEKESISELIVNIIVGMMAVAVICIVSYFAINGFNKIYIDDPKLDEANSRIIELEQQVNDLTIENKKYKKDYSELNAKFYNYVDEMEPYRDCAEAELEARLKYAEAEVEKQQAIYEEARRIRNENRIRAGEPTVEEEFNQLK